MSISGRDVGPIYSPSTWQPAGSGTRTSVQDRISLFETNPSTAGNTKTSNLATSHHFRRWSSSGTIDFTTDNEASSNGIDNKGRGFSRPSHHYLRTFSVEDCYQEEQEGEQGAVSLPEMMLQARRAEVIASTRNHELMNRRLQMKADELERMFAEHKRRIYGGCSAEAKAAVVEEEMEEKLDIERGSLYERYMVKRDAKRREEWGRNREQKEVKARAMWESVEKSQAKLMAWYNQRQDASIDTSLADRSSVTKKDQNPVSSVLAEEEEDKQSNDGSLKSVNSKMLTSRSTSSSTSRISGAVVSRLPSKLPGSRSLRGSVTNTDFRKENTKPSTGISKANAHAQPSIVTRSKSTSAGVNYFKEEKPPRSASLRKSSVTPLTPLRTTKELSRPKPFLKKGSGAGLSKLRTSDSSGLNDQQQESPGLNLNGDVYIQASCPKEVLADYDAALDSPCGSTSSWFSQDGARVRKKWGSVQVPVLVPDGSHQSPKGLKRFLHFGKKSRGVDNKVADCASVSAVSGADYDMEVGRDMVSEQIRNSSMGCPVQSYDGLSFSEGMSLPEQVQTPRRSSVPTPVNSRLRKDHLSESSPKSPRSFFSISAFRNKGIESKLR